MAEHGDNLFATRCFRLALFCAAAVGLGGCATAVKQAQIGPAFSATPVRTLVVESPMAVGQERLSATLAPDIKAPADDLISGGKQHAQGYALAAMQSALDNQAGFASVTPQAEGNALIDKIRGKGLASTITQDEADRLHTATGADALLRFDITDYGLTPKAWRKGFITFEVASTLAVAGIIAYSGSTVAKAAAGAYLVQETVEETATAYAGFWALDVAGRPVRIEAELVRLHPVAILWQSSNTGLSDMHWSRLVGKVSEEERNMQLDQATADAVKKAINDMASALAQQ